jgi:hypothetical protein
MYEEQTNDTYRAPARRPQFELELASGDLVARSATEMFEEFLNPHGNEYCGANCGYPGQIELYQSGQIDCRSSSGRSKDELMKIAISLALVALELAEIELLDRLNEVYLEATTEITID